MMVVVMMMMTVLIASQSFLKWQKEKFVVRARQMSEYLLNSSIKEGQGEGEDMVKSGA